MKKTTSGFLKLGAVIAVSTMALIPSTHSSKARLQPAPATGADLTNEARVIGTYVEDLLSYDKQITDAEKKARLASSDLEPLERRSVDLTRRLSDVQNAVKEISRKLRASGEWDGLDELIQARATDAGLSSHFRQNSFKRLIEDSSTQLTNGADELGVPITRLKSKLSAHTNTDGATFINARYSPAAPMWKLSWGCRVTVLHGGVQTFVRGHITPKVHEAYECACTNNNCFAW